MAGTNQQSTGVFSAGSQSAFKKQLNKVYTWYIGGFLVFVLILAVLEQMGLPRNWIGFIFLIATVLLYAGIGVMSRTSDAAEYYVAGRRVPAMYNGMATGADWMSAASFIGMAGTLYLTGFGGLAFILGWTGGYVLVALFLAPYLRKFGQFTIPDFLGARRHAVEEGWHPAPRDVVLRSVHGAADDADARVESDGGEQEPVADPLPRHAHLLGDRQRDHEGDEAAGIDPVVLFELVEEGSVFGNDRAHSSSPSCTP